MVAMMGIDGRFAYLRVRCPSPVTVFLFADASGLVSRSQTLKFIKSFEFWIDDLGFLRAEWKSSGAVK